MTKILVIGAGAIGGLYSGKLWQAGVEIAVICRSDYEIVKENGFEIKSPWGDFNFKPQKVLKNISEYKDEADFILVATKVLPEISIPDLIAPVLTSKTSIILLQNGIHIENSIMKAFPNHHLISALAFVCVGKTALGKIHHQDYGRLVIGDFANQNIDKTSELAALWNQAGVSCEVSKNIRIDRWKKLVWNAPFNPISVLAGGIDTKKILQNKATEKLAINIMKEICILAEADGCALPQDIIKNNIEDTKKMTAYKTSMLLDFEAKRPMETEAILGNAVRFAESKNVAAPYLSSLYGLLSCY